MEETSWCSIMEPATAKACRCQSPVLTAMAHDAEAQADVTIGKDVDIGHGGGEQRPAAIPGKRQGRGERAKVGQ